MATILGKDGFLFFKKTFFAEYSWQLLSAKLGTPELGNLFPELPRVIAMSTRQRALCRQPLSAKRSVLSFIFLLSTLTNTHRINSFYSWV
jgi:hypothetical protein